jgi:hypothetical protein
MPLLLSDSSTMDKLKLVLSILILTLIKPNDSCAQHDNKKCDTQHNDTDH